MLLFLAVTKPLVKRRGIRTRIISPGCSRGGLDFILERALTHVEDRAAATKTTRHAATREPREEVREEDDESLHACERTLT